MKKIIFFAAAIIGSVTAVNAQSQAKVKVNVELNPFQSIEIGSGAGSEGQPTSGYDDEVTLKYEKASDYTNGVSKSITKQLKVSSVGSGYKIKATLSSNGQFNKVAGNGVNSYDAKKLVEIQVGGMSAPTDVNMEFGPFGSTSTAESSVLNKELDVKYIGKPLNEATVKELLGNGGKDTKAKYTIDVVYTIAAN
ncbi:hypothetical protein [Sphingobacterium sp. 18053]|uniref:hypothetical protein n=1 Tax=Sphingobacterium sp. 18053 TaxID=2681401 RepID=UPI00135CD589|nr:hypothetical protein [Sphingobacterium sp. 18053]